MAAVRFVTAAGSPGCARMEVNLKCMCTGYVTFMNVAIDPRLNLFTRGNTNDGGGWNIRFIHEIQSAEYGYPILFKRYTHETLPALVDVGGGSGTGAMFFSEPGWPDKYNNIPMMCDWGRSKLIIHRVTPDGATFTQEPEDFIGCAKISDVDCDASGRLYVSAFTSGYRGGDKGFVSRVVPKGWSYTAAPDLKAANPAELAKMIGSDSSKLRLAAQQELLLRKPDDSAIAYLKMLAVNERSATLASRIAAIFTLKQLLGEEANSTLIGLLKYPTIREFALRALTDRKSQLKGVDKKPFIEALNDSDPRVQVAAAVSLGRLGDVTAAGGATRESQSGSRGKH